MLFDTVVGNTVPKEGCSESRNIHPATHKTRIIKIYTGISQSPPCLGALSTGLNASGSESAGAVFNVDDVYNGVEKALGGISGDDSVGCWTALSRTKGASSPFRKTKSQAEHFNFWPFSRRIPSGT